MTVEGSEAAADALTGALAAKTIESETGNASPKGTAVRPECLNCGATVSGAYCAACGQAVHIHRSFQSLGHDILHSVFHFDGKFWRTIPELVFRPGRLTRRYIAGERAKFISPMALFLFTMFAAYAVFAFLPDLDWNDPPPFAVDSTEADLAASRLQLESQELSPGQRAALEQRIRSLELVRALQQASESEDWARYEEVRAEYDALRAEAGDEEADSEQPTSTADTQGKVTSAFSRALQRLEEDPDLVFYKMKSNGYKWSWLLVPFSVPFMWALFLWRKEFNLYDHAVFVTYSISFMMMLLIVSTLAAMTSLGAKASILLQMLVPPLHLYVHLRGAYRLSRLAALARLVFVLTAALIVLTLFVTMLLLIGALE